jgi:hypothetical protein
LGCIFECDLDDVKATVYPVKEPNVSLFFQWRIRMASGILEAFLDILISGSRSSRSLCPHSRLSCLVALGTIRHGAHDEANGKQTTTDDESNQFSQGQDVMAFILIVVVTLLVDVDVVVAVVVVRVYLL